MGHLLTVNESWGEWACILINHIFVRTWYQRIVAIRIGIIVSVYSNSYSLAIYSFYGLRQTYDTEGAPTASSAGKLFDNGRTLVSFAQCYSVNVRIFVVATCSVFIVLTICLGNSELTIGVTTCSFIDRSIEVESWSTVVLHRFTELNCTWSGLAIVLVSVVYWVDRVCTEVDELTEYWLRRTHSTTCLVSSGNANVLCMEARITFCFTPKGIGKSLTWKTF